MHPIHDVDAILLLSLSLAAKRRPADLLEIVTAIDLMQGTIPSEIRLSDAFAKLSAHGLVLEADGGYTLSTDAQEMMSGQRKKDDAGKNILRLKELLAAYPRKGKHATIQVTPNQLLAAIQAYRKERNSGRSWLVDKPKPAWIPAKELKDKPLPFRRRKS